LSCIALSGNSIVTVAGEIEDRQALFVTVKAVQWHLRNSYRNWASQVVTLAQPEP
jgi:hypothetical protein